MTPWHPLIVHLPVGLLATAAAVDLAFLLAGPRAMARRVGTGLFVAGGVLLVPTYLTGRADAGAVPVPEVAQALVEAHWNWALWTAVYVNVLAAARLGLARTGRLDSRRRWLPVVAAGLVAVAMLVETAERGGRLVYQYGVGVGRGSAVP